jgi:hypothetical protein
VWNGTRRESGEGGTTKGLTAADLTIQTCWDADRLVDFGDQTPAIKVDAAQLHLIASHLSLFVRCP